MGYYSTIDIDGLKIKDECVEKVKQDIDLCKKNSADYLRKSTTGEHPNFKVLREKLKLPGTKSQYHEEGADYVFWHIETMELDENNLIRWDDEAKFYGEADLIEYLREKVTAGDLMLHGEDNTNWGYRFDGKGNVKKLKQTWTEE